MKKNRWTAILMAVILCFGLAFADNGKLENVQAEESKTVTLYLTRHGKTMLNNTGRMQGWCDSPLTQDGAAVAEKLGQGLKKAGIFFDAAYSSDSGRAIETADLVLRNCGQEALTLKKEPMIREVCFGIYEGATPPEAYGAASKALGFSSVEDMMGAVFSGKISIYDAVTAMANTDETGSAETWGEAQQRVAEGIVKIAEEARLNGQKNVLVVSHGMAISAFLSAVNPEIVVGELGNASITKIVYDGKTFTVESVNDMSYVKDTE